LVDFYSSQKIKDEFQDNSVKLNKCAYCNKKQGDIIKKEIEKVKKFKE